MALSCPFVVRARSASLVGMAVASGEVEESAVLSLLPLSNPIILCAQANPPWTFCFATASAMADGVSGAGVFGMSAVSAMSVASRVAVGLDAGGFVVATGLFSMFSTCFAHCLPDGGRAGEAGAGAGTGTASTWSRRPARPPPFFSASTSASAGALVVCAVVFSSSLSILSPSIWWAQSLIAVALDSAADVAESWIFSATSWGDLCAASTFEAASPNCECGGELLTGSFKPSWASTFATSSAAGFAATSSVSECTSSRFGEALLVLGVRPCAMSSTFWAQFRV
mmetsp:Transcript_134403/g.287517  ORF Transcript_134403/g.287517 Transcript_134403/m.287517 type:complete len:283 (+) Transcript_134403:608-1456(+)